MGIHAFRNGIYPKVNVIPLLEIEFAYSDSTIQGFNHYATRKSFDELGLVTLYDGISIFVGHLMPKPYL